MTINRLLATTVSASKTALRVSLAASVTLLVATATQAKPWSVAVPSPALDGDGGSLSAVTWPTRTDLAFSANAACTACDSIEYSPTAAPASSAPIEWSRITAPFNAALPAASSFSPFGGRYPLFPAAGPPSRLPEPSLWAMFMLGFGMVAASLRVRLRAKLMKQALSRLLLDP
jgi:hypothetical protein